MGERQREYIYTIFLVESEPLKEREKIMAKMNTVKRRILFFHIEEKTCSQGQKGHHIKGITCDERF